MCAVTWSNRVHALRDRLRDRLGGLIGVEPASGALGPWRPEDLEPCVCPLCGAPPERARETLRRADGLTVAVCACGLGYLAPRPRPEVVEALYTGSYFEGGATGETGYSSYLADSQRALSDPDGFLREVVDTAPVAWGGASVLDIGAATGVLLALARERGATRLVGVEPSDEAAAFGREHFGLDMRVGSLETASLGDAGLFDVVTLCEVIEHPSDPAALVAQAARLVAPGGALVLTTPNFGMARYWGAAYPGFRKSLEHLTYWTEAALRRVLAGNRLEVTDVQGLLRRFVRPRAGETEPRASVRKALRPLAERLPLDLTATTLMVVARRAASQRPHGAERGS